MKIDYKKSSSMGDREAQDYSVYTNTWFNPDTVWITALFGHTFNAKVCEFPKYYKDSYPERKYKVTEINIDLWQPDHRPIFRIPKGVKVTGQTYLVTIEYY